MDVVVNNINNQDKRYSCCLNQIYVAAGNSLTYRSNPDDSVSITEKRDKLSLPYFKKPNLYTSPTPTEWL